MKFKIAMRFLILLPLLALVASASNNVDDNPTTLDVEKLAKQVVCDRKSANSKLVISRISTVVKLANFLESLPKNHNLADCASTFGARLNELKNVVSENNDNVCGDAKLSQIQDFHIKFISDIPKDVEARQKAQLEPLTGSLRIFFMYYVLEVSSICRRNLINNLEWDVKDKLTEEDYTLSDGHNLDSVMFGLGEHFSAMKSVNSYDDIVMLWNIVDGSLFAKENAGALRSSTSQGENSGEIVELDNGINPLTGSKIKLFVKSRDPKVMLSLQQKCSRKFKPFYEKLILPIIRLADLGYSLTDESFEKEMVELKQNQLVNRWYVLTQICETVLPIKFVYDKTLNPEETVMISKEEAATIEGEQEQPEVAAGFNMEQIHYEPQTNSMVGMDQLATLESIGVAKMLQNVQTNLSARERNVRRMISRFAKSALEFVKSKANLMFFSRKAEGEKNYVKEDMREMVTKSLTNVNESNLLELQGSSRHLFRRDKPSVATHHSTEIGQHKHRVRIADVEAEKNARDKILGYRHTKSIGQIVGEWWTAIQSLAPNKFIVFLVGTTLCFVLICTILLAAGTISIG